MKCQHKDREAVAEGPFQHSVALRPYTEENRAAHGARTVKVVCLGCQAERFENWNGGHVEVGPWASFPTVKS